jgi:RsiW-degrading membrane proteinase PrsW (M82 family)
MVLGWLAIAALTVNAIVHDGLSLAYRVFTDSASSALVMTDLIVELILISVFIYWDSRRRGKNPVGWIVVTLILGAIGSLGYLLLRARDKTAPPLLP